MSAAPFSSSVRVAGVACASALGETVEAQRRAMQTGHSGLRPLAEAGRAELADLPWPVHGGWLAEAAAWRRGRRYGGASNAAVRVAREAMADAGWTDAEREEAWIFAGSSRGNAGELLGYWQERRPLRLLAASNALHSEVAAAVSIELGLRGPWQVLANGCSAGLDAAGMAWAALRAGLARRALVVSVELPLLPELLAAFQDTRLLAAEAEADPFHEKTAGFHPAEAV
ncbi:MAG: hypothetical protein KDK99_11210, partial [Verrucomicrobiales bacterium]|nr:hypothetical protein [Verrucomicrobiales bacterium]